MSNEIINKLMRRIKVVKDRPDNFVIGDVIGLIDDLEETMLYFAHTAECFEEEALRWRSGELTPKLYAKAQKDMEVFMNFIDSVRKHTA